MVRHNLKSLQQMLQDSKSVSDRSGTLHIKVFRDNRKHHLPRGFFPAGIYLFKVNNGNSKTISEICSKVIIRKL